MSDAPSISTRLPGLPPVHVTLSPAPLLIVAAASGLVQANSDERATVEVNDPTVLPPAPVHVYVPPFCGMGGKLRLYAPVIPSVFCITAFKPAGPVTVILPASRPTIPGIIPCACTRMQPPGSSEFAGS